jgi:hypothetical protein
VSASKAAFLRIAYRTHGEYEPGEVEPEALLLALKLRDAKGIEPDFASSGFIDLLMRHLYQHLIPYADTTVRFATRLDHSTSDDADAPHPLANILVSDNGGDPLSLLLDKEESFGTDVHADNHPSLAAYARLLSHFNNHVVSVSSHLLLSLSHTYKRIAHAHTLAVHQRPLTLPLPSEKFLPGPWRRFKLKRPPEQLAFDFDDEPMLAIG